MEKIWLKNYQTGVPQSINPDQCSSLNEMFEANTRAFADLPAFTNMGRTLTYKALEEASLAFGAYLQTILQVKKGDRIALMMPNLLQYPIALCGALRAGLVVVNVNPLYTPRELERQLQDAGCETIVVLSHFAHKLEVVLRRLKIKHVIVTEIGDMLRAPMSYVVNAFVKYVRRMVPKFSMNPHLRFTDILTIGKTLSFTPIPVSGEDIAFLQYTGGTTGIPKGAMLTHRNMLANIEQACAWIAPKMQKGQEMIITALPMYHIFSLLANCLTFMRLGALNVLVTNPRDMPGFLKILSRHRFTAMTGVNTLFNALLNQPKFSQLDFSHVKLTLGGGMSIQSTVAERWHKTTGVLLLEAYGLTEASPAVCINPLDLNKFNGSIGLPVSSTEISIRDAQGAECGFKTPGELWVRGPQVMKGYWQKPAETAEVLDEEGWLKTGDIATVDELGFVRIVDRKKDLILISGFNVYPNEIEDVISQMPLVAEVAVVGVKGADRDIVKAFIVKKEPQLTASDVIAHCREQLTPYKVPKMIEFIEELPKSTIGKILRRELQELKKE